MNNLYLISQNVACGHDTYDSAVVSAKNVQEARAIHPSEFVTHHTNGQWMGTYSGGPRVGEEYPKDSRDWVRFEDISKVAVEYLGKTEKPSGVILASFNAG